MYNDHSGRYGAPRRKTPPSMPVGLSVSDSILSRSDLAPTEYRHYTPACAGNSNNGAHTQDRAGSCDMPAQTWGLKNHPLAMVYSPWQSFCSLYDEETAFSHGTLFSELYLPFEGQKCGKDRC